ncbi:MAG TPA: hypothetical protein VFW41_04965 [Gaiellaceae bacterium]|nr:hypothetical protein [Gaiellaceae bacterium]
MSTGFSGDWTPIRCAKSATVRAPRSSVSRTKTVLSDWAVAWSSRVRPVYVCVSVWIRYGLLGGPRNGADRYVVENGSMPRATASVSTNSLKLEPAWRFPCTARLNW